MLLNSSHAACKFFTPIQEGIRNRQSQWGKSLNSSQRKEPHLPTHHHEPCTSCTIIIRHPLPTATVGGTSCPHYSSKRRAPHFGGHGSMAGEGFMTVVSPPCSALPFLVLQTGPWRQLLSGACPARLQPCDPPWAQKSEGAHIPPR